MKTGCCVFIEYCNDIRVPFSNNSCQSSGLSRIDFIKAESSKGESGSKYRAAFRATSDNVEAFEEITGRPARNASRIGRPKPSNLRGKIIAVAVLKMDTTYPVQPELNLRLRSEFRLDASTSTGADSASSGANSFINAREAASRNAKGRKFRPSFNDLKK